MSRKRLVTVLFVLLGIVLVVVLMHVGGGWLSRMFHAHMGG